MKKPPPLQQRSNTVSFPKKQGFSYVALLMDGVITLEFDPHAGPSTGENYVRFRDGFLRGLNTSLAALEPPPVIADMPEAGAMTDRTAIVTVTLPAEVGDRAIAGLYDNIVAAARRNGADITRISAEDMVLRLLRDDPAEKAASARGTDPALQKMEETEEQPAPKTSTSPAKSAPPAIPNTRDAASALLEKMWKRPRDGKDGGKGA